MKKGIVLGKLALIFLMSVFIIGVPNTPQSVRGSVASVMSDLNNLDQLKQVFERDRGQVRIVSLLSPV